MGREIIIFSPGKTKEEYLKSGIKKYEKLISPHISLKLVFPQVKVSSSVREYVLKKEAEYFNSWLQKRSFSQLFVLDEKGKAFTSLEFARWLSEKLYYPDALIFYIGGAFGIDESIKRRAHQQISLSQMTFLHEMSRLILLEQLYRAFQILKGSSYHK